MTSNHYYQKLDQQIVAFWNRRTDLTKPEWEAFYLIVVGVLKSKHSSLLNDLPGDKHDYIHDFFCDKVLMTANSCSEIYHTGALVSFYRNYLIDKKRGLKHAFDSINSDHDDSEDTDQELQRHDNRTFKNFLEQTDDHDPEQLIDLLECDMASGRLTAEIAQEFQKHIGIDLNAIAEAARDFLEGQGEWEQLREQLWWIRLYLTKHFCFCATDEAYLPLSELSRRYQIPSYHSRAVKFGIKASKQPDAAMSNFQSSYRGQWLASLSIPVDAAHLTEIKIALKILCLVALTQ